MTCGIIEVRSISDNTDEFANRRWKYPAFQGGGSHICLITLDFEVVLVLLKMASLLLNC